VQSDGWQKKVVFENGDWVMLHSPQVPFSTLESGSYGSETCLLCLETDPVQSVILLPIAIFGHFFTPVGIFKSTFSGNIIIGGKCFSILVHNVGRAGFIFL